MLDSLPKLCKIYYFIFSKTVPMLQMLPLPLVEEIDGPLSVNLLSGPCLLFCSC